MYMNLKIWSRSFILTPLVCVLFYTAIPASHINFVLFILAFIGVGTPHFFTDTSTCSTWPAKSTQKTHFTDMYNVMYKSSVVFSQKNASHIAFLLVTNIFSVQKP